MSRRALTAASLRTAAISHHIMPASTSAHASAPQVCRRLPPTTPDTVLFESNGSLRTYILNRPSKLNALDEPMLSLLRPKIEEWSASDLCGTIVARGVGRAFCIGGDVANVVQNASDPSTVPQAVEYFKREFEMDYILAALKKPYVAILDGMTMGGGVGLAANATFRIATENTVFSMPETKIGYCPDVGGSYFLSRLDGEIGTYLALTSDTISGRAVFDYGLATHYIPSRRIPQLLDRLAELDQPHASVIDRAIEDLSSEREPTEPPSPFTGARRVALDIAFGKPTVEGIITELESFAKIENEEVRSWAQNTLAMLHLRSPTSLKVALRAIRQGAKLSLRDALNMELKMATAFCRGATPDFAIGVKAVLVEKTKERPQWEPSTFKEVNSAMVSRFFDSTSPFLADAPSLELPAEIATGTISNPLKYALPTEEEIGSVVMGSHASGGGLGVRLDEVVARFADLRPGKVGVKEKVIEVVQRRCEVTDNADGNRVWLKWKHR
ncbi:3-hydroxyisobutyryl-CoA hydrolase [Pholiota conissans]|uniref:3-hydroxyisobutyryl-CoA hydrolase n=1 Tax=Pholiota conissans TaxID=109636 RepID=A0A9P5Z8B0_9AGAR|nr:3-hydroxyisobutyryl-CoA hydrolase [Pholiota conissans]